MMLTFYKIKFQETDLVYPQSGALTIRDLKYGGIFGFPQSGACTIRDFGYGEH